MNTLNNSVTHGSATFVGSHSGNEFRRGMITAKAQFSGDSGRRNSWLGAKHQRHSGVIEFDHDAASKLAYLLHQDELGGYALDSIVHVNPEKAFTEVPDDAGFEPFELGFTKSLMENGQHMTDIKGKLFGLNIFGSDQLSAGSLTVRVSSAVKLQGHQMNQIAKKIKMLTGTTQIRLSNTIDPSLIAGFVISYEREGRSHVFDHSVKGQLDELVAHIESKDESSSLQATLGGLCSATDDHPQASKLLL